MHGTGSWDAQIVAPSLASFWKCVRVFRDIARGRQNPVQLEMNPPGDDEISAYLAATASIPALFAIGKSVIDQDIKSGTNRFPET
jgi:hypothetical protein